MNQHLFSVYVIRSVPTGKLYVGMSTDVHLRLKQHNQGRSKFTKTFVPWTLIYSEQIGDAKSCRIREKYLKTTSGKNYLKKIGVI